MFRLGQNTLPPRHKSEREKLLTQLQAYNADRAELGREEVRTEGEVPVMLFVLNGGIAMRAGKSLAQIGHAVLLAEYAFGQSDAAAFARWEAGGRPCAVRRAMGEEWEALKRDERVAIVRDAGITEVAAGSETFLAMAPREMSEWGAVCQGLARV